MSLRKTQLYSHLWEMANALRGGIDATHYKDYVLTILFVKYVTDRYKGDPYAPFVIPEGGSFDDLVEAKGKPDIGERINLNRNTINIYFLLLLNSFKLFIN